MNKYDIPNETWYDFETILGRITNDCFNTYLDTYLVEKTQDEQEIDQEIYKSKILNINRIYKTIYYEFRDFILAKNQKNIPLNSTITQFIKKDTPIISFNYTNLIKEYSDNVYYIHGSVDENFIVFGYSLREEYDYIDSEAAVYDKHKFRELLNYARFLTEEHNVERDNLENYVEEYLPHLLQPYTGKGRRDIEYPDSFIEKCEEYLRDYHDINYYSNEVYNYLSKELKDESRNYRLKQISLELGNYLENEISPLSI